MKKKQLLSFVSFNKLVATDDALSRLTGDESWPQIQSMGGFRHFVLCKDGQDKYLAKMEQRGETLIVLWTPRPETALPFHTTESAMEVLQHLDSDSGGQDPLLMGALIKTKTRYGVLFKKGAKYGQDQQ